MTLGEFLINDNLLNLEEEAKQNKDKFKTLMKEAEICLFGKTLDPIIYTNECDFTKTNDISDPELNKKGLYLFRHFFSSYAYGHKSDNTNFNITSTIFNTLKLTDDFFDKNFEIFDSLNHNDNFFEHIEKKYKDEFLSFVNFLSKSYIDLDDSKTVKYNITPNDEEFEYFYINSFYPNLSWYWFPYKQNLRNSNLNFLSVKNFEHFYSLLLEMSIDNSINKSNNFKIKKQACEKINFDSPPIEKNSLVVFNNQFLHGFRVPRYNCRRNLVSSNKSVNNKPFDFL